MNPHVASAPRAGLEKQAAFTLTDLMVMLAIMALLALLSLNAVAHSQPSSDRAGCANNLRRLMQAWQMYSEDYSGQLMGNYTDTTTGARTWAKGYLDFVASNTANTNTLFLTNAAYAQMGPYVNTALLFRCPADTTTLIVGGTVAKLRVRSYSMNGYVGPADFVWSPSFQVMTKMAEVSQPGRIFVLLEEHPSSINDTVFFSDPAAVGGAAKLVDYPGHFHLGGANLGMADGHVEYWQWSDARTMPPMNGTPLNSFATPNNPDVARLQAAASYLK